MPALIAPLRGRRIALLQRAAALVAALSVTPTQAADAPVCADHETCMSRALEQQGEAYADMIRGAAAGLRRDRALLERAQATGNQDLIAAARQRVAASEKRWQYARTLAQVMLAPEVETRLRNDLNRAQRRLNEAGRRLAHERDLLDRYLRTFGPAREAVEREVAAGIAERNAVALETGVSVAGLLLSGLQEAAPALEAAVKGKPNEQLLTGAIQAANGVTRSLTNAQAAVDAGVKFEDALAHDEKFKAGLVALGGAGAIFLSGAQLAGQKLAVAASGPMLVASAALLSLDAARLYQSAWWLEDARGRRVELELREQAFRHRVHKAEVQAASLERLRDANRMQIERRQRIAALMNELGDLR